MYRKYDNDSKPEHARAPSRNISLLVNSTPRILKESDAVLVSDSNIVPCEDGVKERPEARLSCISSRRATSCLHKVPLKGQVQLCDTTSSPSISTTVSYSSVPDTVAKYLFPSTLSILTRPCIQYIFARALITGPAYLRKLLSLIYDIYLSIEVTNVLLFFG